MRSSTRRASAVVLATAALIGLVGLDRARASAAPDIGRTATDVVRVQVHDSAVGTTSHRTSPRRPATT